MSTFSKCPVPLTVRGTQALVSFAPLAFRHQCLANLLLRLGTNLTRPRAEVGTRRLPQPSVPPRPPRRCASKTCASSWGGRLGPRGTTCHERSRGPRRQCRAQDVATERRAPRRRHRPRLRRRRRRPLTRGRSRLRTRRTTGRTPRAPNAGPRTGPSTQPRTQKATRTRAASSSRLA